MGATNGSPRTASFSGRSTGAGYLWIVICRVLATTLPALSTALMRTVTLPECP